MDFAALKTSSVHGVGLDHVTSILFVGKKSLSTELLSNSISRAFDVSCQMKSPIEFLENLDGNKLVIFNYEDFADECLREMLAAALQQSVDTPVAIINMDRKHIDYGVVEWPNVKGLFHLDDTNETLLKGICSIDKGNIWFPRQYTEHLAKLRTPPATFGKNAISLTPRERQIMELLHKGLKNTEIAEMLFVSPHTIRTHLYKLYKKIGAKNRIQAMQWGLSETPDLSGM
jgi:DNA-binding NarL/FixJ family response regulator